MPQAPHDSARPDRLTVTLPPSRLHPESLHPDAPHPGKAGHAARGGRWILVVAFLIWTGWASTAAGQDWGDPDDNWSSNSSNAPPANNAGGPSQIYTRPTPHWSLYAGIGFTTDPDHFLMNFEVPYRFDRFVSAGLMMQVGVANDRSLVAPTVNVTLTIPDLPGNNLDRFRPNIFGGIGFAVISNDDRGGDNSSAGFLINTGFGFDYVLSERLSVGTRMIFNFLPERTLEEKFWYSWEMGGLRFAF